MDAGNPYLGRFHLPFLILRIKVIDYLLLSFFLTFDPLTDHEVIPPMISISRLLSFPLSPFFFLFSKNQASYPADGLLSRNPISEAFAYINSCSKTSLAKETTRRTYQRMGVC